MGCLVVVQRFCVYKSGNLEGCDTIFVLLHGGGMSAMSWGLVAVCIGTISLTTDRRILSTDLEPITNGLLLQHPRERD